MRVNIRQLDKNKEMYTETLYNMRLEISPFTLQIHFKYMLNVQECCLLFCALNVTHALVCGRSLAGIASSNPPGVMDFCLFECCVLSGRDIRVELITRPEESC